MSYQQLTQEDRYQIYTSKALGKTLEQIAKEIGCHKSTISRELRRNKGGKGYRPLQAHTLASGRRYLSHKYTKFTKDIRETVEKYLKERWSPEQIAGYLKKIGQPTVSHERIYQYIREDKSAGGTLYTFLRQGKRKRRKKYGTGPSSKGRGQIKDAKPIAERPEVVEEKNRIGDWEGDTIVSRSSKEVLVTLVERVSKTSIVFKVKSKEAKVISRAIVDTLSPIKEFVETITFDRGLEFSDHKDIAEALDASVYFADPYSSFQRGLNENTNGLIRQYLPKKTDFAKVSKGIIKRIQKALNSRPRKTLNFSSPNEIMGAQFVALMT